MGFAPVRGLDKIFRGGWESIPQGLKPSTSEGVGRAKPEGLAYLEAGATQGQRQGQGQGQRQGQRQRQGANTEILATPE